MMRVALRISLAAALWAPLGELAAGDASVAPPRRFVTIGTGAPTGVYFAAGHAVCRVLHKAAGEGRPEGRSHGLRCSAQPTDGSLDNLAQIKTGDLDFAFVQSDWQYHAYHQTSDRVSHDPDLRSVLSLHVEPMHLVVRSGLAINVLSDLRGSRINIGNPGSGHRATFEDFLIALGMTVNEFANVASLTPSDQSNALCVGDIDAFFYMVGAPNSSVAFALDGCGAKLIALEGLGVESFVRLRPYYVGTEIPSGVYRSLFRNVPTFGVVATLVTRADLPADVVHELSRTVFDSLPDFKAIHPAFGRLSESDMVRRGLSAPLHPGARRAYIERGLLSG